MATNMNRQVGPATKHRSYANKEFTGKVIDDNDPEKRERIKVRIKGIHDDISDEDIPWTAASRNGNQANGGDMGSVGPIPPKGSSVKVTYPDDSMYFGSYSAASTGEKQQASELTQGQDTTAKNYPKVAANIDSSGNRTTVDNKRDTVDYEHVSGTRISIDGKGHTAVIVGSKKVGEGAQEKNSKGFTLHVTGDVNIRVSGNANIGSDGDINLVSKKNVNISAKGKIRMVADGSIHIDGSTVDINDGSGQSAGLKDLPEPPSRSRPQPNSGD